MTGSRAGTGALIAGAGGVVLFISLFLPWYSVSVEFAGRSASESASGWESLSTIDILLFLAAVVAAAFAAGSLAGAIPAAIGGRAAQAVLVAGALALILSIFRLIDIPASGDAEDLGVDLGRKIGVFIAVIASGAIGFGGLRSLGEGPPVAPAPAAPATPPQPPPA